MLYDELTTPFPWYDRIEKQIRYNDPSGYYIGNEIISPNDAILPFMFRVFASGVFPTKWYLLDLCGNVISDLSEYILNMTVAQLDGYDYFTIVMQSSIAIGNPVSNTMDSGCYYCRMDFENFSMYSEVFRVPEDSFPVGDGSIVLEKCNYLRLEWNNSVDIPPIWYNNSFYINRVFLKVPITASEPEIIQDIDTDGNDIEIPTFQRAAIRYRITAVVADCVKKALALIPMHDFVSLITANGIRGGDLENIGVETNVEDGGILSTVDILFEDTLLMISKKCPDPLIRNACPESIPPEDNFFSVSAGKLFVATDTVPDYVYAVDVHVDGLPSHNYFKVPISQLYVSGGGLILNPGSGATTVTITPLTFNCRLDDLFVPL